MAAVEQAPTSQTFTIQRRKLPAWCRPFLVAYRQNGNITASAELAGISRRNVYEFLENSPQRELFKQKMEDAYESHVDLCVLEVLRRGRMGVDEPVIHQGQMSWHNVDEAGRPCGDVPGARLVPLTVKKYSDSLLLAHVRANRAAYRPAPPPIGDVNVQVNNIHAEITVESVLNDYLDTITGAPRQSQIPDGHGAEQPIHSTPHQSHNGKNGTAPKAG